MNALMGNANVVDAATVQNDFAHVLIAGEQVEHAYKLVRDMIVFTNERLILIDKQGMSGKKLEFHSIPYSKITHFSVETAGTLDLDSEMKVAVSGGALFSKTFGRGVDINEVQRVLATYVLKVS
ncbi:MAG: PH domain-containing protein [Brevundimonas sp.]|nr:PH domain-containing protein [Brevundimonas sp.]